MEREFDSPYITYGGDDEQDAKSRNIKIAAGVFLAVIIVVVIIVLSNQQSSAAPASTPAPVKVWSKTDTAGGSGGPTAFDYKCPDGEYIKRLNYRSGQGVDQLSVSCSGAQNYATTSGIYGGSGGSAGYHTHDDGVSQYTVTAGNYIGNITPGATADLTKGGLAQGTWAGTAKTLYCPSGKKIAGIYGKSGAWLDSLGFHCY